jgi:hypothetical protein
VSNLPDAIRKRQLLQSPTTPAGRRPNGRVKSSRRAAGTGAGDLTGVAAPRTRRERAARKRGAGAADRRGAGGVADAAADEGCAEPRRSPPGAKGANSSAVQPVPSTGPAPARGIDCNGAPARSPPAGSAAVEAATRARARRTLREAPERRASRRTRERTSAAHREPASQPARRDGSERAGPAGGEAGQRSMRRFALHSTRQSRASAPPFEPEAAGPRPSRVVRVGAGSSAPDRGFLMRTMLVRGRTGEPDDEQAHSPPERRIHRRSGESSSETLDCGQTGAAARIPADAPAGRLPAAERAWPAGEPARRRPSLLARGRTSSGLSRRAASLAREPARLRTRHLGAPRAGSTASEPTRYQVSRLHGRPACSTSGQLIRRRGSSLDVEPRRFDVGRACSRSSEPARRLERAGSAASESARRRANRLGGERSRA